MNAIALNSTMFNGARIIGPAIAGVLVAKIGDGWCFFANGISYIAVITGLLLMHVEPLRRKAATLSPWETIREGFHYVGRTLPIRAIVQLIALVSFAGLPYTVLMPIFADKILHGGAQTLGVLMGATGLGALGGALFMASRTALKGFMLWIPCGAAGFSVSLAGFALSGNVWLSCALLLFAGFAIMIQTSASNTLIQSIVPDHLRGRTMSVYTMMFIGIGPIGAMVAGFAAESFGARPTVLAGAAIGLAASAGFAFRLPAIRPIARRLIRERRGGGDGMLRWRIFCSQESYGPYPKAFLPLFAWTYDLQIAVFSFVRQIDSVCDRGHRLKTDVVVARRRVDDCDLVLRSKKDFDLFSAAFPVGNDVEDRPAIGVSYEPREAIVEAMVAQGNPIAEIHGLSFAGWDQAAIRFHVQTDGDVRKSLGYRDAGQLEIRMETESYRHRFGTEVGNRYADFERSFRQPVGHPVFVRKGPVRHQVGIFPEFEAAGHVCGGIACPAIDHLPEGEAVSIP